MNVSLSSRVEVGISYRWVIDSSIDSSIDSRGSSISIVGSDWSSGVGGSNWSSGVGGSSKRGNTVVGYRGSSSVSIGLGVSIGGGVYAGVYDPSVAYANLYPAAEAY